MIIVSAKARKSESLNSLAVGLNDLTTNQRRGLKERDILNLVDFFLVRSPRSSESVKKSSIQTIALSSKNWKSAEIYKNIESTLFKGKVIFCSDQKKLLAAARKNGLYMDARMKQVPSCAFLLKDAKSGETKEDCFFRHLRNAFAHGAIYKMGHGRFLFADKSEGNKGRITAYIITTPLRLDRLRRTLLRGRRA